jgi:VacB/RNase II family 3'-5' exoribonuclease
VPSPIVHAAGDDTPFGAAFARIRSEFEIPSAFPAPVDVEAAAVVKRGPVVPSGAARVERVDARHVPFVTIDPPGSLDLDQAFHAERRGNGFRVHYAIADVAAFVAPGGALDRESFARGVTLYLPDGRAPMLPNVLGEGGASLLPEQERPAVLWTIDLDETGASTSARLERATVRSRAQLDYPGVQAALDNGHADEPLQLLRQIGEFRRALEAARGGVSLDLPSQEVILVSQKEGQTFALEYAAPLPIEGWNAQISLLAGMEAAKLMVEARTGILRVVPAPQPWQIDRLRRSARGLDVSWPRRKKWSDVVRSLDREDPDAAAFLTQAAHLLRGAGYAKLDASNTNDPAAVPVHAGVAAPYAHVTAPLRRLADRYANEIVLAHCASSEPPEWAIAALDELVDTMQVATRREHAVDRAAVDAVECAVLAPHVGEQFDAFVVDRNKQGVVVQLRRPAIIASVPANLPLGDPVEVTLVAVDELTRHVELAPAPAP